jgi:hypothetical protein
MHPRTLPLKLTAIAVIVALQGLGVPAGAAGPVGSRVAGSILSTPADTPIAGARLHLGDPRSGRVFTSEPSAPDGSFALAEVPPATYEVAVESNGGLYVVSTPLELAPGATRNLQVAVAPVAPGQMAPPPPDPDAEKNKGGTSVWNNPATAALIVVGSAIVLGFLIKEGTDDDDNEPAASPS